MAGRGAGNCRGLRVAFGECGIALGDGGLIGCLRPIVLGKGGVALVCHVALQGDECPDASGVVLSLLQQTGLRLLRLPQGGGGGGATAQDPAFRSVGRIG